MLRAVLLLSLAFLGSLLLLPRHDARGVELLANGGFESGTDLWQASQGTLDTVSAPVHSGALAARLTGTTLQQHEVFQWVEVTPGASYSLSLWVLHDDPNLQSVFARIGWYDGTLLPVSVPEDSPFVLTGPDPSYRQLTVGPAVAPDAARYARVSLRVQPNGPFTVYADDFSMQGPEATPVPPPTVVPTEAQTPTPTAVASTTPHATGSPTPTATPRRTPTPRLEPAVFSQLMNGGFETLRDDGTPYGWHKIGGEMSTVVAPRHQGSRAASLESDTTSTKWLYQTLGVQGGEFYEATAYALKNDPDAQDVFLRVSWYESDDGSGESIDSVDSLVSLESNSESFSLLKTGPVQAPIEARTARIRLMLRPASAGPAKVYFDDATFIPAPAPSPTITQGPTATAVTVTPTPSVSLTPTSPPTPTGTPAPTEPAVFQELTNGGFETARDDGTPYAWRRFGGEFATSPDVVAEGSLGLEFISATAATKWVYQTVAVEAGRFYEASALVQKDDDNAEAAFIRVSWYTSTDGSGDALDSADSGFVEAGEPDFVRASTEPILAPSGALTAKVKLMLRPRSDAPAHMYFDGVTLRQVEPPGPTAQPTETPVPEPTPTTLSEALWFSELTNGSFEELRTDGTPYGWRVVGGQMTAADVASEGRRSLALSSATASTKWAFQTVRVESGQSYEARVEARVLDNVKDVFVRISWYESSDGTGESIDQVDSKTTSAVTGFQLLFTGAVQAPAGAGSARIRLMLRPASASPASVLFDSVTFISTSAPTLRLPISPSQAPSGVTTAPTPAALGAAATPVVPVNDRGDGQPLVAAGNSSDDGSSYGWVIALAIGMPAAALGTAAAIEVIRRRRGVR